MKIWTKRILLTLGILALFGIIYAAFAPLPFDDLPPQDKWGAGASSVLPAYSGLQREFPPIKRKPSSTMSPVARASFRSTALRIAS